MAAHKVLPGSERHRIQPGRVIAGLPDLLTARLINQRDPSRSQAGHTYRLTESVCCEHVFSREVMLDRVWIGESACPARDNWTSLPVKNRQSPTGPASGSSPTPSASCTPRPVSPKKPDSFGWASTPPGAGRKPSPPARLHDRQSNGHASGTPCPHSSLSSKWEWSSPEALVYKAFEQMVRPAKPCHIPPC